MDLRQSKSHHFLQERKLMRLVNERIRTSMDMRVSDRRGLSHNQRAMQKIYESKQEAKLSRTPIGWKQDSRFVDLHRIRDVRNLLPAKHSLSSILKEANQKHGIDAAIYLKTLLDLSKKRWDWCERYNIIMYALSLPTTRKDYPWINEIFSNINPTSQTFWRSIYMTTDHAIPTTRYINTSNLDNVRYIIPTQLADLRISTRANRQIAKEAKVRGEEPKFNSCINTSHILFAPPWELITFAIELMDNHNDAVQSTDNNGNYMYNYHSEIERLRRKKSRLKTFIEKELHELQKQDYFEPKISDSLELDYDITYLSLDDIALIERKRLEITVEEFNIRVDEYINAKTTEALSSTKDKSLDTQ